MDKFCGQRMPEGKDIILSLYFQQWCSPVFLTPKAVFRASWAFLPFVALGFIYQVMECFKFSLAKEFKMLSALNFFFLQKQGPEAKMSSTNILVFSTSVALTNEFFFNVFYEEC